MRKQLGIAAGGAALIGGGLALYSALTARRAEAEVPQDGRLIDVGGDRLHYVDKGSGPPIVMVHGLGGQLRNFAASVVDDLARDHRVILVDRPGSGYSVRGPGGSAGLPAQADAIAGLIRALELEKPLLVGHSLGGALSLTLALNHPGLVSGLALIAPLTQVVEEPPPVFEGLAIRSPIVRRMVAWTLATPLGIYKSEETLAQIFAPDPVPADFLTAGGGMLGLRPGNFYETSSDMVAINDDLPSVVARYGELTLPVAILYGRQDNLLDHRQHALRTAAEITGAELDLVDGGHMLPFTAPERTVQFIRKAAGRAHGASPG